MKRIDPGALMGSLSSLSARTDSSEQAILDAAVKRLDVVNARLEELQPQVLTTRGASEDYQGLILERGRLALVIEQARLNLS